MNKKQFRLVHAEARQRAIDFVKLAPHGWLVTVQEPTRNLDQNAALHARITDLLEALGGQWKGYDADVDALKRIFMVAYRKMQNQQARMLPGLDGEPVVIDWRTSGLSIRECSELITMIDAWQAENVPE